MERLVECDFHTASEFLTFGNLPLLYQIKPFVNHYQNMSNYFSHPRLKAAFTFQDVYMGLSPFEAPATFSMMPYTELAHGVWYPKGGMFDAIPLRQNTRSEYDGRPIKVADLDQVQAVPLEPGVVLRFVNTPADLTKVREYVDRGNLSQYADKAFVDELIYWVRFNTKDALASLDGLYSRASGSPEVPRWLGQLFVAGTQPQQQADADAKKLLSSSGAVLVASESDGKTAWVRTGQVYERMALTMTSLNIKSAFLNQPIEVATVRAQFQSAMEMGGSLPQLLVRFGYADAMPRSLRRPVEHVLAQS